MTVITTISRLQETLSRYRKDNAYIGFVPTMGALHEGHLSLVKRATEENNVVVVSIFVNPTQFNDPDDLRRYPRTMEADISLLEHIGKDKPIIVFVPSVKEMYPKEDTRTFNFTPLDAVMEGVARPGHFNGVAQIVSKLFAAVQPTHAYFGEKDFQQLAIIRRLVADMQLPIKIIGCPIHREKSGLAMSSRNQLLTKEQRTEAAKISQTLLNSRKLHSAAEIQQYVEKEINANPAFLLEYFFLCNSTDLQPIALTNEPLPENTVGCIAVKVGTIRLIDNIRYESVGSVIK